MKMLKIKSKSRNPKDPRNVAESSLLFSIIVIVFIKESLFYNLFIDVQSLLQEKGGIPL